MSSITKLSLVLGLLVAGLASPARAQLFTPEALGGAALGAGAGAVIGHQFDGQSGEGALVGAGVGYLVGQIIHHSRGRPPHDWQEVPDPMAARPAPRLAPRPPEALQRRPVASAPATVRARPTSPMAGANRLFGR